MTHPPIRLPTVSIVIPAYNASDTIADAVGSVFRQTWTDFEVVVVDDGSSDAAALAQALAPWRDDILLLTQANAGAGAARNLGLSHAGGAWIAFLDADDVWLPGFLMRQMAVLRARPCLDLVWSDGWIVGRPPLAGRRYLDSTNASEPPSFASLVRQTCTVLTSAVVARRSAIAAVGGFDEGLRRGQDFDLWLRVAHAGAIMAVLPEPLVHRRVHEHNLSGDDEAQLRRAIAVLGGLPGKLMLTAEQRRCVEERIGELEGRLELELAKTALREGRFASARAHLSRTGAIRNWKIRVVAQALRLAPEAFRRMYLLSGRSRLPAPPIRTPPIDVR